MLKNCEFKIEGKNKSTKQIKGVENSFVIRDDMEIGGLNMIPISVFGFMY